MKAKENESKTSSAQLPKIERESEVEVAAKPVAENVDGNPGATEALGNQPDKPTKATPRKRDKGESEAELLCTAYPDGSLNMTAAGASTMIPLSEVDKDYIKRSDVEANFLSREDVERQYVSIEKLKEIEHAAYLRGRTEQIEEQWAPAGAPQSESLQQLFSSRPSVWPD